MSNLKTKTWKMGLAIALLPILPATQAQASWVLPALAGYAVGRAFSGGSSSSTTYVNNETYVDMQPVADAVQAGDDEVASAIRSGDKQITHAILTQDDHSWSKKDIQLFKKEYDLEKYGPLIGLDIDRSEVRQAVVDNGKAALQATIENKIMNFTIDGLLADQLGRALLGKPALKGEASSLDLSSETTAPFQMGTLMALVDWNRRNPGKRFPAELAGLELLEPKASALLSAEQNARLKDLVLSLTAKATKESKGFGSLKYSDVMNDPETQNKILAISGQWHSSVVKSVLQADSSSQQTLNYCNGSYTKDKKAELAYISDLNQYFGEAPKAVEIGSDLRSIAEFENPAKLAAELRKKTGYDVLNDPDNRQYATAARLNLQSWESKCFQAANENAGIDALARFSVQDSVQELMKSPSLGMASSSQLPSAGAANDTKRTKLSAPAVDQDLAGAKELKSHAVSAGSAE